MAYALQNIKAYCNRQRSEAIKEGLYHLAEVLTLIGIFLLGIAIMTII